MEEELCGKQFIKEAITSYHDIIFYSYLCPASGKGHSWVSEIRVKENLFFSPSFSSSHSSVDYTA